MDVQKKAFPFLLHFLFNFTLFSSYFLIAKCLRDACESVENIRQKVKHPSSVQYWEIKSQIAS